MYEQENEFSLKILCPTEAPNDAGLFSGRVTYSEGHYRTAVTCLLLSGMGTNAVKKGRVW